MVSWVEGDGETQTKAEATGAPLERPTSGFSWQVTVGAGRVPKSEPKVGEGMFLTVAL